MVLPTYRRQGIYTKLYEARIKHLNGKPGRRLSCTDNPVIDKYLVDCGWNKLRDTKDEQSNDCRVYELKRMGLR